MDPCASYLYFCTCMIPVHDLKQSIAGRSIHTDLGNIPLISITSQNLTSQRYPVEIQRQSNAPFSY